MGAVFLATMDEGQKRVAIKVPAASRHWRAEYERRVLKEIGILSALQHPNIIAILDWGQDPALGPYIVMEYIEGGSVLQLMAQYPNNRLDPYEALRIAATVADALAYAHSRQPPIIHRDIKPDNILIRRSDGQVKVSDFGLAAVLTSGKRAMTQWGTPDFIAPEQALGRGADGRSDMYGLAATLYNMLTGLRPPSLGLPLPARPSAALTPGILDVYQARRIDFLILTMMAYDPNDRRPAPDRKAWHASDVAEELRAIAERRPAQVYPAPEDSAIFPSLMTGIISPLKAAQQQAQAQRPQVAPQPQPAPQAPPVVQQQPPPVVQPQAQPLPMVQPPPQPPAPMAQVQPLPVPAPQMPPNRPNPQPLPVPAPRPPQAEQFFPPPAPPVAFGAQPAPMPQAARPEQARQPSGFLPPGAAPGPAPHMAAPPNPGPPPAIQVRAAPGGPVPLPAAPGAQPKAAERSKGLSGAERELITGALMGLAGAAALYLVSSNLPQVNLEDAVFNALVFGLMLWGIGLLVGIASPRGRSGRLPWLALLAAILTIALGFPLAQAVRNGPGLHNLEAFVAVLAVSPFLFLGAVGAWLLMKLIGR